MRQVATSTLTNQNLTTALLCATYTADADRLLFVRVAADQIVGNGDYVAYVTLQKAGAGSAYRVVPITTAAVASGVTAAMLITVGFPVKSTDVVKVYLTGLAGDTATPDVITEILEDDSLRPTTPDRTLDVSAGGEAGVDWANIGSPTTTNNLSGTTVGAIGTDGITNASLAASAISEIQVAIASGSVAGVVGNVTGSVGSVAAGGITAASFAAGALQAVWDTLTSALSAANSVGKLLVDNINATIGSRLPTASYTAPLTAQATRDALKLAPSAGASAEGSIDDTLDEIQAATTAIQAKTDLLPTDPGDESDIVAAIATAQAALAALIAALDFATTDDVTDARDHIEAHGDSNWRTQTTPASPPKSVTGPPVSQQRGDKWIVPITDLGDLTGCLKLWVTLKKKLGDTDAQAVLMIELKVADPPGGITRLNGATYSTATNGVIEIDDPSDGDITVTVLAAATALLEPRDYAYDVQGDFGAGDVRTLSQDTWSITGDVTRAVE